MASRFPRRTHRIVVPWKNTLLKMPPMNSL
jgi:hypothetical protein